jgi:hypothetical protein
MSQPATTLPEQTREGSAKSAIEQIVSQLNKQGIKESYTHHPIAIAKIIARAIVNADDTMNLHWICNQFNWDVHFTWIDSGYVAGICDGKNLFAIIYL